MVDARDTANKLKSRWQTKIFAHKDAAPKKTAPKPNNDDDVNDFLKPSTDRALAQKEAATAAFLAAGKPRIDVAKAQRWPGASDVLSASAGKSPGIGGMKSGLRKRGLTVSFVRTQPDIIGEGGDECEEPSIEVSRRRRAHTSALEGTTQGQTHQDDIHVAAQTFNHSSSPKQEEERERRNTMTRTLTSQELSPQLQQKMEMGRINTHASPPPVPPRGLGPMGLGERPRPLQRAPTGFDVTQDAVGRPSLDSTYSYESENISPVASKKAPNLAPTKEEEEDFRPKPLQRTATGWSEHQGDSDDEPPPLPRHGLGMTLGDDNSSVESNQKRYLESEPRDPNSYSAQVIHKMRADEGRALHEAAARHAAETKLSGSVSSTDSFTPAAKPNAFQVGTPPTQFTVPLAGKTPPRLRSQESPPRRGSPPKPAVADYPPHRADNSGRASPPRRHMPPGTYPLDTEARPQSSSSSHYTLPSAASRTRASPTRPSMDSMKAPRAQERVPPSASSQQTVSSQLGEALSANSQNSILPTPPQFERREYMAAPPEPPAGRPQPDARSLQPRRDTVNEPPPNARREAESSRNLGRSDTKAQGEDAFHDFTDRVQHMQGIFLLTAQLAGQLYDHTPMQWLRVATWWFLKGRTGMEHLIRSRPKEPGPQTERLAQPHVDLAKTWWILTEILGNHPMLRKYGDQRMESQAKLARDAGDADSADAYELHDAILFSLKMLLGSMKRHQSMPPTQALIQGQDQSIWVEYPRFAPDAQSVLAGTATRSVLAQGSRQQFNPAILIPVGDTKISFCYFRYFATASISTDDPNTDRVPLPIVISVIRPRDAFQLKLSLCSQSELVNVVVGSNPDDGPTWRDVGWRPQNCALNIQLRHGFNLSLALSEQDFRGLRGIVDHTNRVESNLRERTDERMCAKMYLRDFNYVDSSNPGAFPPGRVPGCKLMVFQRFERSSEGTGRRKLHRGYRLVVVTNPNNRTLSCVSHEMGTKQEPMDFGYLTDSDNAPGLCLKFKEETPDKKKKLCTMTMFFKDPKERNHLFGTFTSMNQAQNEAVFAQVPLKSFSIESADPAEGFSQSGKDVLKRLQWMEAKALNMDPDASGLETAPTVMSESLRIVCRHSAGVISDRMNLGMCYHLRLEYLANFSRSWRSSRPPAHRRRG